MEAVLLAVLILLNGVFAMSEISVVSARNGLLRADAARGRGAAAALQLKEDPTAFLSTVQIGITCIGILNGIVGEAALAPPLGRWLQELGIGSVAAERIATGLVVVAVTYATIVFGELVPKRLGQMHAETVARRVARPMQWLAALARPFVRLLTASTRLALAALGARDERMRSVSEEDIHALLAEGSEAGVIEAHERDMVRNVFRLDDRPIGSLMVPRRDVVFLDPLLPWEENARRIETAAHTRYPVARRSLRDIAGVVSARQILIRAVRGERPDLESDVQAPIYVPESLTGLELLQNFRASSMQLAFVVDEYGEVLGIITLRDLLEAIIGDLAPQEPEDRWAVARGDGSWLLDGLIPVPELKDVLGLGFVPEEGRYHTLSGMLMVLLGKLPQTADRVEWQGWSFEVVDMDGKRMDKVLATPNPKTFS
ncbi:MAG TPA: hemolysin family protein [Burkholderiales bacterium]|nr:hemolysin family protein [Burkholderiales bacterium]